MKLEDIMNLEDIQKLLETATAGASAAGAVATVVSPLGGVDPSIYRDAKKPKKKNKKKKK